MAIEVHIIDENTVRIPGAVEIKELGSGRISVKLLTTPISKWVDNHTTNLVPAGTTMGIPAGAKNYEVGAYDFLTGADGYNKDLHSYANGNNYLSISESTTRATERIYHTTWGGYEWLTKGEKKDLARIVHALIKKSVGRDEAYRLAGRAKNLKDTGQFKSNTLVNIMQWAALMDGKIETPVIDT